MWLKRTGVNVFMVGITAIIVHTRFALVTTDITDITTQSDVNGYPAIGIEGIGILLIEYVGVKLRRMRQLVILKLRQQPI